MTVGVQNTNSKIWGDITSYADRYEVQTSTGVDQTLAFHSNLDIGTFVLDAFGERWVVDLGADDYNLPGYFETGGRGRRWTY